MISSHHIDCAFNRELLKLTIHFWATHVNWNWTRFPFNKLRHFQICIAKCLYSYKKQFAKNTFHKCQNSTSSFTQVPFKLQKKPDADPLTRGPDQFCLNFYMGNNQVRLMIEKCNSTHARNHCRARQAHMKKMLRNEDTFTQCFQTAKGVRSHFFFRFCYGPKTRKKQVWIHFMKTWYRRFTRQKYLAHTNFFFFTALLGAPLVNTI